MQPYPEYLLLDCDDVLLNFLDGFRPFASRRLGRDLHIENLDSFDMSRWLGTDHAGVCALIEDFTHAPDYARLPPFADARPLLETARAAGMVCHVITAATDAPQPRAHRERNIADAFGPLISHMHILGLHGNKHDTLSSYPPSLWIEDNFDNAVMGAQIGHETFVLRKPHNRHLEDKPIPDNMSWADSLAHVHEMIFTSSPDAPGVRRSAGSSQPR